MSKIKSQKRNWKMTVIFLTGRRENLYKDLKKNSQHTNRKIGKVWEQTFCYKKSTDEGLGTACLGWREEQSEPRWRKGHAHHTLLRARLAISLSGWRRDRVCIIRICIMHDASELLLTPPAILTIYLQKTVQSFHHVLIIIYLQKTVVCMALNLFTRMPATLWSIIVKRKHSKTP